MPPLTCGLPIGSWASLGLVRISGKFVYGLAYSHVWLSSIIGVKSMIQIGSHYMELSIGVSHCD